MAVPQFLQDGTVDYLIFDYLAEITMSIMARARAKDPAAGYATDFVSAAMRPNLHAIAASGIRIIANAGGVNPQACATALKEIIREQGLNLSVAVVSGDDLMPQLENLSAVEEMFSKQAMPDLESVASANAYLGAFPIAAALDLGADIVITGRCVDSALTLGACIHAFGWSPTDLDLLAAGSLAGHIIECGPQATGGNFTDWHAVAGELEDIGYPIADIQADGLFTISKPEGTGGLVSPGSVGEQMLYEIGNPAAYILPDVVCDFSQVTLEQSGENCVAVSGARGKPAPDQYKVSMTWMDGWRIGTLFFYVGEQAAQRAKRFAEVALARARKKLRALKAPDYSEVLIELHGDENHYGEFAEPAARDAREVTLKLAAKHADPKACGLLLKEATGLALGAPSGLTIFSGGRPKPSPVVRLFSFLVDKSSVNVVVEIDGQTHAQTVATGEGIDESAGEGIGKGIDKGIGQNTYSAEPTAAANSLASHEADTNEEMASLPLHRLAFARSGDKGNHANIGVLPRRLEFGPWIWAALTEDAVRSRFTHFLTAQSSPTAATGTSQNEARIERFYLPGTAATNLLLRDVLGGGGIASLRNDPQGKTYAQILLQMPITIPRNLVEDL